MLRLLAPVILFAAGAIGFVLKFRKKISEDVLNGFVAIGAGAMIGVSLLHIFPEIVSELPLYAAPIFLAGFVLIYLIENAFMIHTCAEHECHFHHVSILSWIAIFGVNRIFCVLLAISQIYPQSHKGM